MASQKGNPQQLRTMIIKQLRTTADASTKYQNKWLSDDNWIRLINEHDTNSTLTSPALNAALSGDPSTKNTIEIMDGTVNKTGIFRRKFTENDKEGRA
jgi:hypothetical protein